MTNDIAVALEALINNLEVQAVAAQQEADNHANNSEWHNGKAEGLHQAFKTVKTLINDINNWRALADAGFKIQAIKAYRQLDTHVGLKTAKDVVEAWMSRTVTTSNDRW